MLLRIKFGCYDSPSMQDRKWSNIHMENEAQEIKVIWKSHGESCSVSWDCDTEQWHSIYWSNYCNPSVSILYTECFWVLTPMC